MKMNTPIKDLELYNECHRRFNYCDDTGVLTYKIRVANRVQIGDVVGSFTAFGYLSVCINSKHHQIHRIVWLMNKGKFPENQLDHISHVRTDNRMLNLREVTNQENAKNKRKSPKNTSGTTGVTWAKNEKRWKAQIMVNRRMIFLGQSKDINIAIQLRKDAEKRYNFHNNHGS